MIGNALDWYDFALYGTFAVIIGHLYFPNTDPTLSLMAAYGTYAAGFIMRPVGAVLFGYIGDKWGRKSSLAFSILLMAIPTACIGFLPTYAQIGIWAPICLTIIRLLQGLSLGGEFSGSITFLVEHAPVKKRGLVGSATVFSLAVGMLMGSVVATICSKSMSAEDLQSWGWRIPFIIGIVIAVVGFYIRHYTDESPEFEKIKKSGKVSKTPVRDIFKNNSKQLFIAIGSYLTVTVPFYALAVFSIAFLNKFVGYGMDEVLFMNAMVMLILMLVFPISGYLSDRIGRKKIMVTSAVLMALLIYPIFWLMAHPGGYIYAISGLVIFSFLVGFYSGPIPAFLVDLFPAKIRYTGIGLSYNIAAALFGGTFPLIATYLIKQTGMLTIPAVAIIICALISLFTLKYYKDPITKE
jgi:MHS family proline/betaine transporter-like MFS transporter